jgi:hypothetical protein
MHPLVMANFQAVHSVIQTGIHCYHFKNDAFINRIALRQQPENPSETIGTLKLLIASPITHACDKVQSRNILDYLVMLAEMYGRGVLQPDGTIEAFDLALEALRESLVQEHRKRCSYSHLGTHISEPAHCLACLHAAPHPFVCICTLSLQGFHIASSQCMQLGKAVSLREGDPSFLYLQITEAVVLVRSGVRKSSRSSSLMMICLASAKATKSDFYRSDSTLNVMEDRVALERAWHYLA